MALGTSLLASVGPLSQVNSPILKSRWQLNVYGALRICYPYSQAGLRKSPQPLDIMYLTPSNDPRTS